MLLKPRGIFLSAICQAIWFAGILLFCPAHLWASEIESKIVCRDNLVSEHRAELTTRLQKITGWSELKFDTQGILRIGGVTNGGSKSARELLTKLVSNNHVVVLEDVSRSSTVAFAQVIPGRWRSGDLSGSPFVVQIDFADFEHVLGDKHALQAFNVGWGLLHELDHIVNDSEDAILHDELGECEDHINQMRKECNLPVRAEYFYTLLPISTDSAFMNRLVRLGFEQELTRNGKKKRYWLIWDANLVGGIYRTKQIASLR